MQVQVGFAVSVALAFAGVAAAQPPAAPAATTLAAKGEAVTITGCVLEGTKKNSVVLTHVHEGVPGAPQEVWLGAEGSAQPDGKQVIYWLNSDSVKTVLGHVGQRVEIQGKVSDISQGSVTIEKEPGKEGRDNKMTVSGRGKEAKAKTETDLGVGPAAAPGTHVEETTSRPVHRIKVDSVKMVSPTCP